MKKTVSSHTSLSIAIAGLIAASAVSLPAQAQIAGSSVNRSGLALEEVIVTARKREQSLQDVSLAVTALPESLLKDSLIGSSEELANLVPSLNLNTAFVKNVTDEWYVTSINAGADTFTPNGYVHQVPRYAERTLGVEGRYRW